MIIEKRVRALVTDSWGDWIATTDAPTISGYVDTDLVEYRVVESSTVDISDVTHNTSIVTGADGKYEVTGDGYFDILMATASKHLKTQFDNGRITGPAFAQSYTALYQNTLNQAIQFALSKQQAEVTLDTAKNGLAIKKVELNIAEKTQQNKIDMAEQQLSKLVADTAYVDEQKTQLIAGVKYNNKLKTLAAIGGTYGTFGAGGINLTEDMWDIFYNLAADIVSDLNRYRASWDATTAFPVLADVKQGDFVVVTVNGTTNVDGNSTWVAGNVIVYDGELWKLSTVGVPADTTGVKSV